MASIPLVLDPNDPLLKLKFGAQPLSQGVQQPQTLGTGPTAAPPPQMSLQRIPAPGTQSPDAQQGNGPDASGLRMPSPRAALQLVPNPFNGGGLTKLPTPGDPSAVANPPSTPGGFSQLGSSASAPGTSLALQRLNTADNRLDYLTRSGSGIQQIDHPVDANGNPTNQPQSFGRKLLHGLGMAGDIAYSAVAPGLAALTPGTTMHHQMLVNQAQANTNNALGQIGSGYQLQDMQAQAQQRQALAAQEQARAQALLHPKPSNGQFLYDKNGTAIGFQDGLGNYMGVNDPNLPPGVHDILSSAQRKQPANAFELWQQQNPKGTAEDYLKLEADGKNKPLDQQLLDALSVGDTVKANNIQQVINRTKVQPAIAIHDGEPRSEGTWTPGFDANKNPVMFNSKTGEVRPMTAGFTKGQAAGQPKLGSDEQKRADLAQNLNENIDQMEEILGRRPDLFGPFAGRMTDLRNLTGTGDPDIAKLETIKHNLGMVAQGAHSLRSAQGVETTANSLLNSFHNSPDATRAGLEAARTSVRTFLQDSQNPGQPRYAPAQAGDDSGDGGSGGLVQVQIPGQAPGSIPRSALAKFQRDHPNAKVGS